MIIMKLVILDLETTGIQGPDKGGRIIEIGAVKIENFSIVDRFSTFVNPEQKIPKKITELTGITNDMVKDAPTIWNVIHKVWGFIEGYTVVTHNTSFDWNRYLKYYFEKIGKHPTNDVICTIEKSKQIFKDKEKYANKETNRIGHKLVDLCDRLDVKLNDAHRAINDCEALAHCFLKMYYSFPEYFEDIKNYEGIGLDSRYNNQIDFKIHSVNYWEDLFDKGTKKERRYRRFYVKLAPENMMEAEKCYPGTIFFDIENKSWGNRDFLYNIDYKVVERMVLEHTHMKNLKELYDKMRPVYIEERNNKILKMRESKSC